MGCVWCGTWLLVVVGVDCGCVMVGSVMVAFDTSF